MVDRHVEQVRQFNRAVTQRVGALNDRYLGCDRPLGEARLLFEIGADEGVEVRTLRQRLDLDSGYASRLLRSLKRAGLVVVAPHPDDGRVRTATLTTTGRREVAKLNSLSDELAAGLLEPLSDSQRSQLVEAMADDEQLLRASAITIEIEDPTSATALWCLQQYFAELDERFDDGFEIGDALPADAADLVAPTGAFVVARSGGEAVGCGALKQTGHGVTNIKRMWVARSERGSGLGRRLLSTLETIAGELGFSSVRLETNRNLTEAVSMYRKYGYEEVEAFNDEPYGDHWFVKQLT